MPFIDDTMMAPKWQLNVGTESLDSGIADAIESIEFESYDGMADMMRIRMQNPRGKISNAKVFQPGNEISLFGGYGNKSLSHIGRVIIVRQSPNFPQDGFPTLEVTGYSKESLMMDSEPEKSKDRTWFNEDYSKIVGAVSSKYGFNLDTDPYTKGGKKTFIQKTGMSDYELVKGISNITGYYLWVDADPSGAWTLHFRNPDDIESGGVQEKKYTFRYNFGDAGTLLSFKPEMLIKGAKTKIVAKVKDPETGKILSAEFEEDKDSPDLDATGQQDKPVEESYQSGASVKLYLNNFAFDVITSKQFKIEADLVAWANQWFKRMRDNFVLAQGSLIGLETMAARQTHTLEGVSPAYDGDYYFTKVRHKFDNSGYTIDFGARKVL